MRFFAIFSQVLNQEVISELFIRLIHPRWKLKCVRMPMNFGLASEKAGIFRGVNKLRPEFSVTFADKNKLPKTFGISVCDTFPVFYGTNDVKTFFRVLPTKMIGLMKRRSAINQSVIEWCSVAEWGNQWTMMQ